MTQKTTSYTGPFFTMVFLFFIVGFMTVVFQQFQEPMKIALLTDAQTIKNTLGGLIAFTWFLAYPLTGGIGSRFVNKYGYRGTLVRALIIMIFGFMICEGSVILQTYSPSSISFGQNVSIPSAFFLFLVGTYIVGGAVTIMQVVINPYLVACDVKGTSDVQRQNIGGSSNSIGTTLAPYFVGGIVFGGVAAADISVDKLITPFAIFMVVVAVVAFVVSKLKLPNIANTRAEAGEKLERSVWSFRHLTLGVIAIFIYVGVEVCVGMNIVAHGNSEQYALGLNIFGYQFSLTPVILATLYWFGMLVGRLVGSTISKISARTQLTFTTITAMAIIIVSMTTNIAFFILLGLCHSIMWPATFSLAVKGMGKYTSAASGVLMIGVLGGGVLPLLQSMLADITGGWNITWIVVFVGEIYLLFYALVGSRIAKGDQMTK